MNCKAGDLLYCKSRTTTECCFNNHSCAVDWNEINANFGAAAIEYLKDKVGLEFFFFQLFLGIFFFLLSSFFSHSGDYFVRGWFPHCFSPW